MSAPEGVLICEAWAGSETKAMRDWLTANGVDVNVTKYAGLYRQYDGTLRLHLIQYLTNDAGNKYCREGEDDAAQESVVVDVTQPLPDWLVRA